MAGDFAVDDLIEITVLTRCGAQNGLMVFHHKILGNSGTGTTFQQCAAAWDAAVATHMKDTINIAATYLGMSVQRILPAPKSDKFFGTLNAGVGNREDDLLVTQAAGVVSVRTNLAGRSKRGRKYFPFPSETDNDPNGHPTSDYKSRIGLACTDFFTNLVWGTAPNTTESYPVVYSRRTGLTQQATRLFVRREWGTQRRRSQINRGDLPPTP